MVNTIKKFTEQLNSGAFSNDNEILEVIETNGWHDLTFEDCLDKECTLYSICSDGKDMVVFNSDTEIYSIIPDIEKREKREIIVCHRKKETDVHFKSITGHDICIRVTRISEPGYDTCNLEMSIDGGEWYDNISEWIDDKRVYYEVHDKDLDKYIKVIIPDEVRNKIALLRNEDIN